ncbi:ankyrin [Whalleya microplaca]|nr:ankyrin [Whalleya microplaca]
MATKTQKIPNYRWVEHKDIILSLYLTQDLTLQKLAQTMSNNHGFIATQSQYEAQLRTWNVRKNLQADEWKIVLEKVDRLVSQGLEPRVVISGHPVSPARVHRARRYCKEVSHSKKRRRVDEDEHDSTEDLNTNHVTIEIKGQDGTWSLYLDAITQEGYNTNREQPNPEAVSEAVQPASLDVFGGEFPWPISEYHANDPIDDGFHLDVEFTPSQLPTFNDVGFADVNLGLQPHETWTSLQHSNYLASISSEPLESQPQIQLDLTQNTAPQNLEIEAYLGSPSQLVHFDHVPLRTHYLANLPFEQFANTLVSKDLRAEIHSSVVKGPRQYAGFMAFVTEVTSVVAEKDSGATTNHRLSELKFILQELHTILPRVPRGCRMTRLPQEDLGVDFQHLLLFSTSNGFIGMENIPIEVVSNFFHHNGNLSALLPRLLRGNPGHVAKSLAENLFRAAIESCDKSAVKFLLITGLVNADKTICFVGGVKYTPLERAAQHQDLQLIKMLLQCKVNANKTFLGESEKGGGLGNLITALLPHGPGKSHHSFTPEFIQTVDALIQSEARVYPTLVYYALSKFARMDLAKKLLDNVTPIDHADIIRSGCLYLIVTEFSDIVATQLIENLLRDCEGAGCKECTCRVKDRINEVLVAGSEQGYVHIVRSLFQYVKSPTKILSAAINSANRDMISFALSKVSDLHAPAKEIAWTGGYQLKTTPLAEAIRAQDEELIRTLESRGALEGTRAQDNVEAEIVAACEVGDLAYLRKLLQLNCQAPIDHMPALLFALQNRRKGIVRVLLNLPIFHRMGAAMHSMTLEAALEWGDKSVLHDLASYSFECFHRIEISGRRYTVLSKRLEAGDLSLFDFCHELGLLDRSCITQLLEVAIQRDDCDMLQHLIEAGADASDEDALAHAARGHTEILRLLLDHAPRLSTRTKSFRTRAVVSAIKQGHENLQCLDMLIMSGGIDLTSVVGVYAPLALAIDQDGNGFADFPLTRRLLDAGCDPNNVAELPDYNNPRREKNTGLLKAIKMKNKYLVRFLIDRGANVNHEATLGIRQTPLQAAAEESSLAIAEFLLQRGAEVNGKPAEYYGGTALQFAAMSGNCNIAALLLERGADLNAPPSIHGRWPLEGAAEHGRLDMIQLLWNASRGGFPVEQCHEAMQLAEENGHGACKDLIAELVVLSEIIPTLEGCP